MSASKNAQVEAAYLKRITGYEVTEEKREYKVTEDGRQELVKKTETVKHVPGDVHAAEFWLTNRKPEKWKPARLLEAREEKAEEGGVVILAPVESEEGAAHPARDG